MSYHLKNIIHHSQYSWVIAINNILKYTHISYFKKFFTEKTENKRIGAKENVKRKPQKLTINFPALQAVTNVIY